MPKTRTLVHSFNTGEVSTAALARVDQEKLRLAAETQYNLFPHVIGSGMCRPGTGYLAATKSNNRARLIPFIKSVDDTAVLELTDGYLRVMVDDALVTRPSVTSTIDNGTFTKPSATITVTIASPAVVTWTSHGFSAGQSVTFKTTGALPTGITAGTVYYVQTTGLTANAFRISTTNGGSDVNTSGTQSGVHTGDASWVTTITGSATSSVASSRLTLKCGVRGGTALARQAVTTSSTNTQHAINVVVDRGPVAFRVGSSSGGDEYIAETLLDKGTHSLAFTPTASPYYIQFFTRSEIEVRITSVSIEAAGVMAIAAPWVAAELREIRTDESADIVYLAHTNWQSRKIERRGDASWSLVYYKADDGPFMKAKSADLKLTPSVLVGNGTLTADRSFFTANHVGALFRVDHDQHRVDVSLSGLNEHTDSVKVIGATSARTWTFAVTGTWVGTMEFEYSFEGPDSGFVRQSASTINFSAASYDAYDNVDVWYRLRFSVYTSGTAVCTLSFPGEGGHGIGRVVAFNSSTSVDIEVLKPFYDTTISARWLEGEWSTARGWPSAVQFFDGRLGWAREDKFWLSESDDYTAFNLDTTGDSGSIQRNLATGGSVNNTVWMMALQRLLIGTDGSESSVRSSSFDQPLTPTATSVKDASTRGSAKVSPAKLDGRGVFLQRSGVRLYEIAYSVEANDYSTRHLTRLNEEIGGDGLVELAVQREPQTYLWAVRSDGQCVLTLYDVAEQVAGFFRFVSDGASGEVESVCVLPGTGQDQVYLAIKRTISGGTVRYIEKLAKHSEAIGSSTTKLGDSGTLTAGPVSSVTLAHLASQTGLVGWGTTGGVSGPITGLSANGSGVISLGATYTNVWVGLPYSWRYKTAKLAYGGQDGTQLLSKKRVGPIGLLLKNTHPSGITFGPDFTTMDSLPTIEDGTTAQTTVYSSYDEQSFPFEGEWDSDSRVCLAGAAPYPVTVLGLVVTMETNEP